MDAVNPSAPAGSSPFGTRGDGYRGRGRGSRRERGRSFHDGRNGEDRKTENQRGGGRRGGRGGNRGTYGGETGQTTLSAMGGLSLSPQKKIPYAMEKSGDKDEADEVEAEVCFICASPVVHNSVAPCNHRTCHICALRMRALYKTKDCAHCRASTLPRSFLC